KLTWVNDFQGSPRFFRGDESLHVGGNYGIAGVDGCVADSGQLPKNDEGESVGDAVAAAAAAAVVVDDDDDDGDDDEVDSLEHVEAEAVAAAVVAQCSETAE
ncbi:hypothetical protein BGZ76_002216, partial [Entomortierella beljakovae]